MSILDEGGDCPFGEQMRTVERVRDLPQGWLTDAVDSVGKAAAAMVERCPAGRVRNGSGRR
jgi:hypothetical protein